MCNFQYTLWLRGIIPKGEYYNEILIEGLIKYHSDKPNLKTFINKKISKMFFKTNLERKMVLNNLYRHMNLLISENETPEIIKIHGITFLKIGAHAVHNYAISIKNKLSQDLQEYCLSEINDNQSKMLYYSDKYSQLQKITGYNCGNCSYSKICAYYESNNLYRFKEEVPLLEASLDLTLSDAQKQLIESDKKLIKSDSVAGAGKTTTLIEKIINTDNSSALINKAKPEEICVITFTNVGANEVKKSLLNRSMDFDLYEEADRIHVSTFHALANSVIVDNYEVLGFLEEPRLFTDYLDILYQFFDFENIDIKSLGFELNKKNYQELASTFSKLDNYMQAYPLKLKFNDLDGLYAKFKEFKLKNNYLTFGDLVPLLYQAINLQLLKFKYVIIDEFQDSSEAELYLVQALNEVNPDTKFIILGDTTQGIFEFRDALPEAFQYIEQILDIQDKNNFEKIDLLESNRVPSNIAEYANKIASGIENMNKVISKNEGGDVYEFDKDEFKDLMFDIYSDIKDNNQTCAVLFQTNNSLLTARINLMKYMPLYLNNIKTYSDSSEYQALDSLLKFIRNKTDIFAFTNALQIINPLLFSVPNAIDYIYELYFGIINDVKYNKINDEDIINTFLNSRTSGSDKNGIYLTLSMELNSFKEFDSSIDNLINGLEIYGSTPYTQKWDGKSIFLSTIHSSKGMQFDYVVLHDYKKSVEVEYANNQFGSKKTQVDKKVAYTAMTRGKKVVYKLGYTKKETG